MEASPLFTTTQPPVLQSPYEIIRDARADMMGARPVPTSRPFTPKERDRVLFGATRRGARPPSAVNLSYLQKSDGGVVKLPTILPNMTGRRLRQPTRSLHALSLDNLAEDAEQERDVLWLGDSAGAELPGLRKSYSSPQERIASNSPVPGKVLSNKWMGVPRQASDPLAPILPLQRKKVHRLRSIKSPSDDSDADSLPHNEQVDRDNVGTLELGSEKQSTRGPPDPKTSVSSKAKNISTEHTQNSSFKNSSEPEPAPDNIPLKPPDKRNIQKGIILHVGESMEKKNEDCLQEKKSNVMMMLNDSSNVNSENIFENGKGLSSVEETPKLHEDMSAADPSLEEDNMRVVLSNGKLVWEPVPQKEDKPVVVAEEKPPVRKDRNIDTMRQHLVQMQNRMRELNGHIDRLGSRVSSGNGSGGSGADRVFYMNENKRYHTSTKSEPSKKTYKKYLSDSEEPPGESIDNPESPVKNNSGSSSWDFFWKNSYFRTREEPLRPELLALIPMLDQLNEIGEKQGKENDQAEKLIDSMYLSLKAVDAFSPGWLPANFTSKLLHTLYKFADEDDPRLLLLITRLLLAVRVDSALAAASKIIFKVTKSDINDYLFIQIPDILELFLDGIGRASPLDSAESCIYGYGALKFLTANSSSVVLAQAVHLGVIDLIALHLKMVNNAQEESVKMTEQTHQAIFQLTAALRNMADGEGIGPLFLTTNCLPALAKSLTVFRSDEEIVTNVARTLSSLSTDEQVAQVLVELPDVPLLIVDLLSQYQNNAQLVVRMAYTLGNLLASSDSTRVMVSRHAPSLTTLLQVLQLYVGKQISTSTCDDRELLDDIIVKVVRVVANMAINGMVGGFLSADARLATALRVLIKDEPKQCNAVLLAALGCLNNLSYYVQPHSPCWLELTRDVAAMLAGAVEGEAPERAVEACRVLGNLTRHKPSRDLLYSYGGVDTLGMMVEWGTGSVVRSVCGVLVNMLLDQHVRQHFLENQGVRRLLGALERFQGDWILAGLVCRAIWNACAPDISLAAELIHMDMDRLLTTLANCLEEDNWTDGDAEWEEFAGVATDLLERFNSHLEIVPNNSN